jgi:hypothetical protein
MAGRDEGGGGDTVSSCGTLERPLVAQEQLLVRVCGVSEAGSQTGLPGDPQRALVSSSRALATG